MKAEPGTWGQVWVGGYVQDLNGVAWKLVEIPKPRVDDVGREHQQLTLRNRNGETRTIDRPGDFKEVTRLVPTMEDGVAVIESVLGGRVISDVRK